MQVPQGDAPLPVLELKTADPSKPLFSPAQCVQCKKIGKVIDRMSLSWVCPFYRVLEALDLLRSPHSHPDSFVRSMCLNQSQLGVPIGVCPSTRTGSARVWAAARR